MNDYIGTVLTFAFGFAPKGWATCQGQLLPINQNGALFALIGNSYGGDGLTNFALPDLRGRVAVGAGQGPGLSAYSDVQGRRGGQENVQLTTLNLPAHTHPFTLNGYSETGDKSSPQGALPANTGSLDPEYRQSGTLVQMSSQQTQPTGSGQPFSNLPPFLTLNYCICIIGVFPSNSNN